MPMGFTSQADAQALFDEGIRAAAFLRRGFQTSFTNVLRGQTVSGPVAIFDFRYRTDDPDAFRPADQDWGNHWTEQTVFAFDVRESHFPDFVLGPRRGWLERKTSGWLERQDDPLKGSTITLGLSSPAIRSIDFPERPEFSSRYELRAVDVESVRALFRPDVLDFFGQQPRGKLLQLEKAGNWLLVFREGVVVRTSGLEAALEEACQACGLFRG